MRLIIKVAAAGAGLTVLLWTGGHHGQAALTGFLTAVIFMTDVALFPVVHCRCDKGWVRSPLSGAMTEHRACGVTGRRRRLTRRLLDRAFR